MIIWKVLGSILFDIYKAFWVNTTKRPWTYCMREAVIHHPKTASFILPFVFAALIAWPRLVDAWIIDKHWWWFLIILNQFAWLLTGHLFWDTAGSYVKQVKDFRKR